MARLLGVKAKLLPLAVGLVATVGTPVAVGGEPPLQVVLQTGHTQEISSVALSSDGKLLVTGSEDRTAILWESSSGKKVQTFLGHTDEISSVALSGDGKQLV